MTVTELRIRCGQLGLPKYQHHGKRLLKADLIAQIERAEADGYQLLPSQSFAQADNGASGVAFERYEVLKVIVGRASRRYADPSNPKLYRTKKAAVAAIQQRLLAEAGSICQRKVKQAKQIKQAKPLSQQQLNKFVRGGQYAAQQWVGV